MGLWWNNFQRSWFYSDSHNDLPLLLRVTDPVVVDPDATLRAYAEKQWPILSIHAGSDSHATQAIKQQEHPSKHQR